MAVETMQVPRQTPRLPGAEDMVARRIAYERKRRGWSNAELARRMTDAGCPINQSAIQKIEHGTPRRTISLDEAHALVEVFGLKRIEDLERVPEELVHEDLRVFVEGADSLREDVRTLLQSLGRLGPRLAEIRENAQPSLEYVGLTAMEWHTDHLQAALTDMAETLLKIRDELAANPLRLGKGENPMPSRSREEDGFSIWGKDKKP
jgi:transcriptional regulator with XRE-family HTH domain